MKLDAQTLRVVENKIMFRQYPMFVPVESDESANDHVKFTIITVVTSMTKKLIVFTFSHIGHSERQPPIIYTMQFKCIATV